MSDTEQIEPAVVDIIPITPAATDVARYDPAGGSQAVVVGHHVSDFQDFAKVLAVSELLPDGLKGKPGNIFMALMQGLDLGLRPMQALNLIDVIKGKPCMNAQGMRALIMSKGHEINVVEWTAEKCVIEGRRKGSTDWRQASFTIGQAQAAGLAGDNWRKYPADMLLARATSRLAKAYFADVTNGLATYEELLDISVSEPPPAVEGTTVVQSEPDPEALHADVLAAEAAYAVPTDYVCQVCGVPGVHLTEDCPEAVA